MRYVAMLRPLSSADICQIPLHSQLPVHSQWRTWDLIPRRIQTSKRPQGTKHTIIRFIHIRYKFLIFHRPYFTTFFSNEFVILYDTWKCSFTQLSVRKYLNIKMELNLILLTWRIWWAPNNSSKWQMGINLAFKGLIWNIFFSDEANKVHTNS